jgi:hypothetical protein
MQFAAGSRYIPAVWAIFDALLPLTFVSNFQIKTASRTFHVCSRLKGHTAGHFLFYRKGAEFLYV